MSSYFKQIPNVEYSKFTDDGKILEYETVKNIFKRGIIREDIFRNLSFFSKYFIIGDERPDQVADKAYDDPLLDWVVLLSNNIINVASEWPMTQRSFEKYLLEKYGSYEELNSIHHFESEEVRDTNGSLIIKEGTIIPEIFTISYYDSILEKQVFKSNISTPITNYEYESRLEAEKRTIFILKPIYLSVLFDDIENVMTYKEGSTQYVSRSLKKSDDIRMI